MSATTEDLAQSRPAHTLHLEILYNGIAKPIEIARDATVRSLLERAIALFGPLPQPHTLALWTQSGVELKNEQEPVGAAHVNDGESLILRPSTVKGGS